MIKEREMKRNEGSEETSSKPPQVGRKVLLDKLPWMAQVFKFPLILTLKKKLIYSKLQKFDFFT